LGALAYVSVAGWALASVAAKRGIHGAGPVRIIRKSGRRASSFKWAIAAFLILVMRLGVYYSSRRGINAAIVYGEYP
jgi:hypothetical protein